MSFYGMLGIAAVIAMAYFIYKNLRVREFVTRYARDYCRDRDLQFLDGTASITAISPTQLQGKLMLQRTYRFEYTDNGANRRNGVIIVIGDTIQHVIVDHDILSG
ncbi:MAG: DUF3301 domain-containing protein [Gammaproteobacteria bacterium]|nr:DUF3301 domain-containing protein [Gammaproteobacteria bacterium]MDH3467166.1 DUF3301 domain-containing protein [Gammaproteobacteria bacterium]